MEKMFIEAARTSDIAPGLKTLGLRVYPVKVEGGSINVEVPSRR